MLFLINIIYTPVTLGVTTSYDQSCRGCWPSCDGPADLQTGKYWSVTDLGPLCNHLHQIPLYDQMAAQRFSVVFIISLLWSTNAIQWFLVVSIRFSGVFSSRWSLIVCDQSTTSHWHRSPTSHWQVGDNRYKLEGSQRLVIGRSATGRWWAMIYVRFLETVVW